MKKKILLLFLGCTSFVLAQQPYKIKTKDSGANLMFQYTKGTVFNNQFYFNANSDETPVYTLLQYDGISRAKTLGLVPLTNQPVVGQTTTPVEFNNKLYFGANIGNFGNELCVYDGVNPPTLVADIYTGFIGGVPRSSNPDNFFVFNGKLLFAANGESGGVELHEYDGVNPPVKYEVNPFNSSNPNYFTEFNSKLYFAADGADGNELYEYDGVNAPTLVADINPIGNGLDDAYPAYLTVFNGKLHFAAQGDTGGTELWEYDGVNAPSLVADLNASGGSEPQNLIVFNGNLYFTADDGTNGRELWMYDGTNTPSMVADINLFGDGFRLANQGDPLDFVILDNTLYFAGDDGSNGNELMQYDGINPPSQVADINLGLMDSNPRAFTVYNGAIYFSAEEFGQYHLYKYHPNETRFLDIPPSGQTWFAADNWSNGVPTASMEVYLPETADIALPVDAEAKKLTLEDGAQLEVKKGINLDIDGDLGIATTATLELEADNDQSATLFVAGTSTGDIVYKRQELSNNQPYLFSPPVAMSLKDFVDYPNQNVATNIANDKYLIGVYNDANTEGNKWEYVDKASVDADMEGSFVPAKGYQIEFSLGGPNYYFTGEQQANATTGVPLVMGEWNSVGNPYLSFYAANGDANSALADNASSLDDAYKALYFWSQSQGKYIPVTEEAINTRYIHPGQGFLVKAKPAQANSFVFLANRRSEQPATSTVSFNGIFNSFNGQETASSLELSINNLVSTLINLQSGTTNGLDIGEDIGNFDAESLDIYTKLVDPTLSTANFSIQSIGDTAEESIPLGIKANAGTYTIRATFHNNISGNVYLQDTQENTLTEIADNTFEYTFTLAQNTNGTGRFFIVTSNQVLSTEESKLSETILYSANKTIHVKNITTEIKTISIYDLSGKLITVVDTQNENQVAINMSNASSGIYLVTLKGNNSVSHKKVMLQ
ncbi:T9SS type A sorting domain-containing protein [Kordia algicida OT-1]|uniref:Secretion system C-terminal sorting domain-containing protein n=1 Tax=Kordia algicida OT-1 TaxID=391587 RepID=A9ECU2_9FLAO|nr:T9SS type A sorting domain-containing protein [Kordia algicida]EDP94313.1 hypothetical protein KAOT1_04150 [Kordia algicida OT-1]